MSRLDQIRRMSDDDLILFLRRYKSEKSSCNRCTKKDTRCNPYTGDYVALNEWNSEQYTGKCTLQKIVYILNDPEYCKEGYVILGLEPCAIGEIRESRRMLQGRSEEVPVYDRK